MKEYITKLNKEQQTSDNISNLFNVVSKDYLAGEIDTTTFADVTNQLLYTNIPKKLQEEKPGLARLMTYITELSDEYEDDKEKTTKLIKIFLNDPETIEKKFSDGSFDEE